MGVQIITANRLRDGTVVYLSRTLGWSERIGDSRLCDGTDDRDGMLAVAARAVAQCEIIDPYAIDIVEDGDSIQPLRRREAIRAVGPSIRFGRAPAPETARR